MFPSICPCGINRFAWLDKQKIFVLSNFTCIYKHAGQHGPFTTYPDANGEPEVMLERPGIRRYIWKHAVDLNRILHHLIAAGGTFSGKKLQICKPSVQILGRWSKWLRTRQRPGQSYPRMASIQECQRSKTIMGLCGTICIRIPNYSQIASNITSTWRKGKDFKWTETCQQSFDTLKGLITSAPALLPIGYTFRRPIILSVDSSHMGVVIILSQLDHHGRKRQSRYGSLPFSAIEVNYFQPKLELYGLFCAMRHFRLYLVSAKNVRVEVDAKYIREILNEPETAT